MLTVELLGDDVLVFHHQRHVVMVEDLLDGAEQRGAEPPAAVGRIDTDIEHSSLRLLDITDNTPDDFITPPRDQNCRPGPQMERDQRCDPIRLISLEAASLQVAQAEQVAGSGRSNYDPSVLPGAVKLRGYRA